MMMSLVKLYLNFIFACGESHRGSRMCSTIAQHFAGFHDLMTIASYGGNPYRLHPGINSLDINYKIILLVVDDGNLA